MALFNRKEKKRVLIVEDDALLAKVLVEKFSGSGFEVINIVNGLEVQSGAERFDPAVILLDLILPGLDGFEVLKLLKKSAVTRKIPVVIMSNLGEEADVRSARALGAVDYFIKANMSMEKLINFVKKNY